MNKETLPYDEAQFLLKANKKCKCRVFDASDYAAFKSAYETADEAANDLEMFYKEVNGGGTCNSYKYAATTARWCVYTTPEGEIVALVDRVKVYGRNVPCGFNGGCQSYMKWFREKREEMSDETSNV